MKENVNEKENSGRLSRILALVELLREHPEMGHTDLAKNLKVTVRQLYIDKASLEEAGFEFHWDRGRKRHVIEKDPFKQTVSITYQEAISLVAAVKVLDQSPEKGLAQHAKSGLLKLLSAGTAEEPEVLTVKELLEGDSTGQVSSGTNEVLIETVARAILSRKILEFFYAKPKGDAELRRVQVYSVFAGGLDGVALYIDAWDLTRKEYRTFKMSRMSDWKMGASFKPRTDYSYKDRFEHVWQVYNVGLPPRKVKLYVDAQVAKQVAEFRRHPSQKAVFRPDGSMDLTFEVSGIEEVLWWSLLWEGHIYVIEPKELVEAAKKITTRLVEAYID